MQWPTPAVRTGTKLSAAHRAGLWSLCNWTALIFCAILVFTAGPGCRGQQLAAKTAHTCFITTSGQVNCFGFGAGTPPPGNFSQVSSGCFGSRVRVLDV